MPVAQSLAATKFYANYERNKFINQDESVALKEKTRKGA